MAPGSGGFGRRGRRVYLLVAVAGLGARELVHGELKDAMQRGYVAAFRLLGNPEQARDACQEAAARALSAAERYDSKRPFYPWFYRILKNHCLDRLRERKRTALVGSDEGPSHAASAEAELIGSERERAVSWAIAELGEGHREVIELRHFQDLSYEEMAALLEVPEGTVMSRLYRARKRMRELLAEREAGGRERSSVGRHGRSS